MPRSFYWFAVTAVVFAIQLVPVTGIFMMMLAAPFWSVATLNLAFLGTGWEAATGRVGRAWLILPLLWFGGYETAAVLSRVKLHSLEKELLRENSGRTLAFDPARHALVLDSKDDLLSGAAEKLVEAELLPVAYESNRNFAGATHLSHRLGTRETCERIIKDPAAANAGIRVLRFHRSGRPVEGGCLYYAPKDPPLPAFRASASGVEVEDLLLPRRHVTIRVEPSSGQASSLRTATARPFGWIPMPVIGCAILGSDWKCFATLYRERTVAVGGSKALGGGNVAALADALGLGRAPAAPPDEPADRIASTLDGIVAARIEESLANLDRMIAGEANGFTVHDVAGLGERPDLLAPRAEKMAAAYAVAAPGGYSTREKARVLRGLLAMLAPADFRRVEDRLLRLYERGLVTLAASDRDPLVTRLGDLGPRALPMLERHVGSGRLGHANVILGLCRVGEPASRAAEKVAAVLRATSRSSDGAVHSAAYVALLRMGRGDLADSDPDSGSGYKKADYEKVRRSVGPASPRHVCVDDWGLPKLPDVPGG